VYVTKLSVKQQAMVVKASAFHVNNYMELRDKRPVAQPSYFSHMRDDEKPNPT